MTGFRFFTIILIYLGAAAAWAILGGTITYRTADLEERLSRDVDQMWGPAGLAQEAPTVTVAGTQGPALDPDSSRIDVRLEHHERYRGLLWFSTYTVAFRGTYTVKPDPQGRIVWFEFVLPADVTLFENLGVAVDDQPRAIDDLKQGNLIKLQPVTDGAPHAVTVTYKARGRDRWTYALGDEDADRTAHVRDFLLTATTNFRNIDYSVDQGGISPTEPAASEGAGMRAAWKIEDAHTRQRIGIEMPHRLDAGPVAGRMAYYAPVSLLFFFTVLFTVMLLQKVPLHPMHYLFISAGFFAFHILLAYLVDKIDIYYAFWVSAVVSVFLVVSYMQLVAGLKFAVVYVGLAQLVYLIGFSYAFFWTGWTGLTVVIMAVVTLFVLMQATGRVNWSEVFRRPPAPVKQ